MNLQKYSPGTERLVTNAASHLTNITAYDAHGQPLTIVDPNGLMTTFTYDDLLRDFRTIRKLKTPRW